MALLWWWVNKIWLIPVTHNGRLNIWITQHLRASRQIRPRRYFCLRTLQLRMPSKEVQDGSKENQSVGHLLVKKLTPTRSQYRLKKSILTFFDDTQFNKFAKERTSPRIMYHQLLVCPGRSQTSYRRFWDFVWAFRGGKSRMKFNAHTPADFRSRKNS